jgi:ferrous iron transport protein B
LALAATRTLNIALLGNPNTGKTTVFNALTGFRARVGNYAGVTVERKVGTLKGSNGGVEIHDLPGTYSIAARSLDEMVAVDLLLGHRPEDPKPDAVLIVVDASNLERNLFLATQVMECGLPCALILNMVDVAEQAGIRVDAAALAERLGIDVYPCVASTGRGIDEVAAAIDALKDRTAPQVPDIFPPELGTEVATVTAALRGAGVADEHTEPFLVKRALLESGSMAEDRLRRQGGDAAAKIIDEAKARLAGCGIRLLTLEAKARYGLIRKLLEGVVVRPEGRNETISDRIDRILIHKVWGTVIFAVLMLVVFQAIYTWSAPVMDAIDGGFAWLGSAVSARIPAGPLQSFVEQGVIGGVGGVLVFLPQILVLFFFIAVLEDCGYIARAAFLMDRLLSRIGLSGRSFIPMLSSFACAIPGIMATRTIEDRRDRLTTILVAPLMSCSARLPVYTLLIGAFIPDRKLIPFVGLQGVTLFAMYALGMLVAIPVALILKRTLLKGATPAFIMELPPYRVPGAKTILHRMWERAVSFLKRAGTIIFAVSVIVWALTYYPRPASLREGIEADYASKIESRESQVAFYATQPGALSAEELLAVPADLIPAENGLYKSKSGEGRLYRAEDKQASRLAREAAEFTAERDRTIEGAYLRQSLLGRMGHVIEPVVKPLGWDWKIGMGAIASFPAREVIVATLGIIYDLGGDTDEESSDLREKLQAAVNPDGTKVFSIPVALSIMVFFALCAQCAATLAVIKRETNSWRWPLFSFAYMTALAYVGAFITFQVARAVIGLG